MVKTKMEKKSDLKYFLLTFMLTIILLSFLMVFCYLFFRIIYREWEEDFLNSRDILFLNMDSVFELEKSVEEKIGEYNLGGEEYSFIQLTLEESLFLFFLALEESLPYGFTITDMGLIPYSGSWFIYFNSEFYFINLPWFGFNLQKDYGQSIDIFIDDFFIADISLKSLVYDVFLEDINSGLDRALKIINDGNFAGRVFENIELMDEFLIVRSRNIDFF